MSPFASLRLTSLDLLPVTLGDEALRVNELEFLDWLWTVVQDCLPYMRMAQEAKEAKIGVAELRLHRAFVRREATRQLPVAARERLLRIDALRAAATALSDCVSFDGAWPAAETIREVNASEWPLGYRHLYVAAVFYREAAEAVWYALVRAGTLEKAGRRVKGLLDAIEDGYKAAILYVTLRHHMPEANDIIAAAKPFSDGKWWESNAELEAEHAAFLARMRDVPRD